MSQLLLFLALACPATAQILIVEFHATPAGGEPEWIECVNTTDKSIRLDNWIVCDSRLCVRITSGTVPAGGFVVLTRDAVALRESRWLGTDVVAIELALPSLNNSTDRIELRFVDSTLIDSVSYDMRRNVRGRSVERVGLYVKDHVEYSLLWRASLSRDSATCGYKNSVITLERDLGIDPIVILDYAVSIDVGNVGALDMPPTVMEVVWGVTRIQIPVPALSPGRYWTYTQPLPERTQELFRTSDNLRAFLLIDDDRPFNDTIDAELAMPPLRGTVLINEVMSQALPRSCDYVEIWNGSSSTIDLEGWMIEDASATRHVALGALRVPVNGYGVIAGDTSIRHLTSSETYCISRPALQLNVSSDLVLLRTASGFLVDQMNVDDDFHHPLAPTTVGVSLEKRRPEMLSRLAGSWTSCADLRGGTPGRPNSVTPGSSISENLLASPNPFSSDPGSNRGPTLITWTQPFEQAVARLVVFTPNGEHVRELLNAVFIARSGSVAWNGMDTNGLRASRGLYVVVLECVDASSSARYVDKCLVVIGE